MGVDIKEWSNTRTKRMAEDKHMHGLTLLPTFESERTPLLTEKSALFLLRRTIKHHSGVLNSDQNI